MRTVGFQSTQSFTSFLLMPEHVERGGVPPVFWLYSDESKNPRPNKFGKPARKAGLRTSPAAVAVERGITCHACFVSVVCLHLLSPTC